MNSLQDSIEYGLRELGYDKIMIFYDYARFAFFASQFLHITFVSVSLSISWPNSNFKFAQAFVFCNDNAVFF